MSDRNDDSSGQYPENMPESPLQPDERRIRRLALIGFLINVLVIPLLLSLAIGNTSALALIPFWLIIYGIIWGIINAISKQILKRRGFRTARIFIVVSIFVAALPYTGCVSLLVS